ncbi:MAG: exosortase/archaeosortase family protein [Candidatus Latescibacterota bacterium]
MLPPTRSALRFSLYFIGALALLTLFFELAQNFLTTAFMYPVSWAATNLLNTLGIAAELDSSPLDSGFCDLILDGIIYRIIHECTGIFALLVFLGLVSAYPTSAYHKVQGMLLGLPAFYLYSCLRLVILGIVAHIEPSLVELFHLYMMVLINLGFLLFVWIYWLEKVVRRD